MFWSPLNKELVNSTDNLFLCTLRGHAAFLNYDVFLSLKSVLILANSADPDEMQHYAAFHLGLRCLPKYPFMGFPYAKGFDALHSSHQLWSCRYSQFT